MSAYYNENDPAAAHLLRHLVSEGIIAPGDVDDRSIKEVSPDDVKNYTQCHWFAGGGLWSIAARSAGWPDHRPLWTASCPCQPFSDAGQGAGEDDPRHLWPDLHRILRVRRPAVIVGEQVAGKAGYGWFDGVCASLEGENYTGRAVDFPACSIDAPHERNRMYWVALAERDCINGRRRTGGEDREKAPNSHDQIVQSDTDEPFIQEQSSTGQQPIDEQDEREFRGNGTYWSDGKWISCADGKARRAKPGIRFLVDGLPGRLDLWRIGGNAIVPQAATETIGALMDVLDFD